jgi:hypothetical protein
MCRRSSDGRDSKGASDNSDIDGPGSLWSILATTWLCSDLLDARRYLNLIRIYHRD